MENPSSEGSDAPKRAVRPNFAEDVYGENKTPQTSNEGEHTTNTEYSDSLLAQRRHVNLLKLKQLKDTVFPQNTESADIPPAVECPDLNDHDLEFSYFDCDSINAELAELYSYSELDDFAGNYQAWKRYCDRNQIDTNYNSLPSEKQRSIISDICCRLECAESENRLSSCRVLLYILQGGFAEFSEEDDVDPDIHLQGPVDRGTGGFEAECIQRAYQNAHTAYSCGIYQVLCSALLTELAEPFDNGLPLDGRDSKASSRDSRSASNADLSDHERRRRTATMADNEALRIILACLCHLVELIRNEELAAGDKDCLKRRQMLLEELQEPIDHYGQPLIYVLFEMMPQFYTGVCPHFPMKKVFLLVWKILLFTLGGWDVIQKKKEAKRMAFKLPYTEDTLTVAAHIPAVIVNDGDAIVRAVPRKNPPPRIGAMALARQMACSGSEEGKVEDEEDSLPGTSKSSEDEVSSVSSRSSRQTSGDLTPRAQSPTSFAPKKILPWKSKVTSAEIEAFLQQERQKFFSYQLPEDSTTTFGLPIPIHNSLAILKKNLYVSVAEIEAKKDEELNRYLLSMKENIEENSTESLYKLLLPNMVQYIVALLKVLLAAAPSNKAKNDALNILVDVLTPETDGSDVLSNSISLDHSTSNPLEDTVRLSIDINRHKEILVKSCSAILILLCKHFKVNHIYQFEYFNQHVVYGNGIPLLLKFLDQNMIRYVQSRHEIHAYNYPQVVLHYVRNREEWPTLNSENVEDCGRNEVYYMWRNVFSSINLVRVLNKLVKGRQSRVMMLMVFKSAPILKRSLKIRLGIFQLYVLKALKMQSRYLGRQWRRSNMDIMSAIYSRVRHRMTDDWAFANETRKSYDYHNEENELKAAVERFHSRRYSRICPQLAIQVNDAPLPGDDYLNRVDIRDYTPVDICSHSVLGTEFTFGDKFRKNYEKWMEHEVFRRKIDWDKLLQNTAGACMQSPMTMK